MYMNNSDTTLLVKAIVEEQKLIMGPLAIEVANKVNGLQISEDAEQVQVTDEGSKILTDLVHQYEKLFGQASVEVCKDAVREVKSSISSKDFPDILQ